MLISDQQHHRHHHHHHHHHRQATHTCRSSNHPSPAGRPGGGQRSSGCPCAAGADLAPMGPTFASWALPWFHGPWCLPSLPGLSHRADLTTMWPTFASWALTWYMGTWGLPSLPGLSPGADLATLGHTAYGIPSRPGLPPGYTPTLSQLYGTVEYGSMANPNAIFEFRPPGVKLYTSPLAISCGN